MVYIKWIREARDIISYNNLCLESQIPLGRYYTHTHTRGVRYWGEEGRGGGSQ